MRKDQYGQHIYTESEICDLYMSDPDRHISSVLVDRPISVCDIVDLSTIPRLDQYIDPKISVTEFDCKMQTRYLMPDSYKEFDIAKYVLDLCQNQHELQRAGKELLMFEDRNLMPLLRYLKFLVDTMRENNIVWGVGRGSSVASFVLFLIGVHKINSLFYDLPIEEFLK